MYTDFSFWITQKGLLPLALVIIILAIFSLVILFCIHINSENNIKSKGIVRKVKNIKILKYSCYFCILLFLVYIVGYPLVHNRWNKNVAYENCYICSDKYFADLWEENNLALFNTNTGEYIVLEFNKYDDDKILIPNEGGYVKIQRLDGKDSSSIRVLTDVDNKKIHIIFWLNDQIHIKPDKVKKILCIDCYNDFFNTDNYDDYLDIALINFNERSIIPLKRTFKYFQTGDYLVEYDNTIELNNIEPPYQEQISILISETSTTK